MNGRPDLIIRAGPPQKGPLALGVPGPLRGPEPSPPPHDLRILLVEDNAPHAELVEHFLRSSGLKFHVTRVETREAFLDQLEHHPPDMILSDYALPAFDGYAALA